MFLCEKMLDETVIGPEVKLGYYDELRLLDERRNKESV